MFIKRSLIKRLPLLRRFFGPEIYPEVFFAHFHKLPNEVHVSWFRDDGLIIGRVNAGGKEFVTQGTNADDFIKMVNQSIVMAFNIPDDYFEVVNRTKTYSPKPSERKMLEDSSVSGHSFGLIKNEQSFKLA